MIVGCRWATARQRCWLPTLECWRDRAITDRKLRQIREGLLTEVIPRVEAAYLVTKDSNSRAIAGSRGWLGIFAGGFEYPGQVGWIGAVQLRRNHRRF